MVILSRIYWQSCAETCGNGCMRAVATCGAATLNRGERAAWLRMSPRIDLAIVCGTTDEGDHTQTKTQSGDNIDKVQSSSCSAPVLDDAPHGAGRRRHDSACLSGHVERGNDSEAHDATAELLHAGWKEGEALPSSLRITRFGDVGQKLRRLDTASGHVLRYCGFDQCSSTAEPRKRTLLAFTLIVRVFRR